MEDVSTFQTSSSAIQGMILIAYKKSVYITIISKQLLLINRPCPSSPGPLFQNEGRCSASDMEIIFYSYANKTYFHKKGCAPSLILKVRVFGTRKWPNQNSLHILNLANNMEEN